MAVARSNSPERHRECSFIPSTCHSHSYDLNLLCSTGTPPPALLPSHSSSSIKTEHEPVTWMCLHMMQILPASCVQQQRHRQPCCAGTSLLRGQQRQPPISRQHNRRCRAGGSQDFSRVDDAGLQQQQQLPQQQQWQQQPSSTLGLRPGFQQQQQRPSNGHITASLQVGERYSRHHCLQ